MKLTKDNVEAIVIMIAAAGVGYVLWKSYGAISDTVSNVEQTVTDAYNAVSDTIGNTAKAVKETVSLTPVQRTDLPPAPVGTKVGGVTLPLFL